MKLLFKQANNKHTIYKCQNYCELSKIGWQGKKILTYVVEKLLLV